MIAGTETMAEGSCWSGHTPRVMRLARTRRVVVVVGIAGLLVLAGCSGLGGDGAAPMPTDDGDGTEPTPTDGGDGVDADVDSEQLRSDALSAIAAVETYRIRATQETLVSGPRDRESSITDRAAIDRTSRELRRNRTLVAAGREIESTTYVVDRTLYSRSDVYVQQYSAEWIRSDASENFSRTWRLQDVLGQLERVLENADGVVVTGVETVDGREAYRTRVDISPEAFRGVLLDVVGIAPEETEGLTVDSVEYVYWLDTETARPLRTTTELSFSVTLQGQTFDQTVSTDTTYVYDDVSIDLPEAAEDAVNVSDGGVTPRVDAVGVQAPVADAVSAPLATDPVHTLGPGRADRGAACRPGSAGVAAP